jgi:hypothetical protein
MQCNNMQKNVHVQNKKIEVMIKDFKMKNKINIITILLLSFNFGCLTMVSPTSISKEENLRKRIEMAYQYYQERNFDKFIDYFDAEISQDTKRQESIDNAKRGFPILVSYRISKIEINGDTAKVKIECVFKLKGIDKEEKEIHFDYWIFQDNAWFIYDYGKMSRTE